MPERSRPPRRSSALTLGVIGLVLCGAAVATGAIPTPDGTINACYSTSDPQRRLVRLLEEGETCTAGSERPISWSQRGPTGPQGAPGAQGPQGPPGPAGAEAPAVESSPAAPPVSSAPALRGRPAERRALLRYRKSAKNAFFVAKGLMRVHGDFQSEPQDPCEAFDNRTHITQSRFICRRRILVPAGTYQVTFSALSETMAGDTVPGHCSVAHRSTSPNSDAGGKFVAYGEGPAISISSVATVPKGRALEVDCGYSHDYLFRTKYAAARFTVSRVPVVAVR